VTELAAKLIEEEEGRVPYAYTDSMGFTTIGVGHLIDARKGGSIPDFMVNQLLEYDLDRCIGQAQTLAGWEQLNEVQRAVVLSMVFQLGIGGVKGFRKFCGALAIGNVREAAREGRDSKWWREDAPKRAERAMKMLETGLWVPKG
jgi:lysozyme